VVRHGWGTEPCEIAVTMTDDAPHRERMAERAILERISDAYVELDPAWRFVYVNRRAEPLLRRTRDELIGRDAREIFPEVIQAPFRDAYLRAAAEDIPVELEAFYPPYDAWYEVRAFPTPEGLSVFFHDVTARKRAEAERKELRARAQDAEARYRSLFDGIRDAILVTDAEARYIDVNPAATELLGYSRQELLTMRVPEVVANDPHATTQAFEQFKASGVWRGELNLRRRDGSVVPTEGVAMPVPLPTGTIFASVTRDISERRAHERMRQEFLAEVGHELRTPLTTLLAYAQLLQRRAAYNPKAVDTIVMQAQHLARLVADILELSRIDAGKLRLRPTSLELVALAQSVAEEMQGLTTQHRIRVEPERPEIQGWGDEDRLRQVLQNLVGNAVRYAPDGEIVVRVEADEPGVRVAVRDEGPGIAADVMPHLFDRFYRGMGATVSSTRGFGLGLFVARELIEAHGGRVWAEPTNGAGSTFVFTLPDSPSIP